MLKMNVTRKAPKTFTLRKERDRAGEILNISGKYHLRANAFLHILRRIWRNETTQIPNPQMTLNCNSMREESVCVFVYSRMTKVLTCCDRIIPQSMWMMMMAAVVAKHLNCVSRTDCIIACQDNSLRFTFMHKAIPNGQMGRTILHANNSFASLICLFFSFSLR